MTLYKKLALLSLSLLIISSFQLQAQTDFAKKFVPKWDRAVAYTIEVIEAMPEDHLSFRPVEEVRTFEEQALHLIDNFKGLQRFITGSDECPLDEIDLQNLNKAQLITVFKSGGAFIRDLAETQSKKELRKSVPDFFIKDVDITKEGVFHLISDHMAHHRGQMILYLRLNGIKPPRYRGW